MDMVGQHYPSIAMKRTSRTHPSNCVPERLDVLIEQVAVALEKTDREEVRPSRKHACVGSPALAHCAEEFCSAKDDSQFALGSEAEGKVVGRVSAALPAEWNTARRYERSAEGASLFRPT